jgi:hypothetical protein
MYVFLVPQEGMKTSKKACIKDMIEAYAGLLSFNEIYRYEHKESEVKIGGIPFSLIENSLLGTTIITIATCPSLAVLTTTAVSSITQTTAISGLFHEVKTCKLSKLAENTFFDRFV